MIKLQHNILKLNSNTEFKDLILQAFATLKQPNRIVRLTIFYPISDNRIYTEYLELLNRKAKELLETKFPNINLVAQQPLDAQMAIEYSWVEEPEAILERKTYKENTYTVVHHEQHKELFLPAIQANLDHTIKQQSDAIFHQIKDILKIEEFEIHSIYRQWNYIEQITESQNDYQNYQQFNDSRSEFYAHSLWKYGYPAATGIGAQAGGVLVECMATNRFENLVPIQNPDQIDAHIYTSEVLIGEQQGQTTPKFERAKLYDDKLYISGTAAILGEKSEALDSPEEQTLLTLKNIERLANSPVVKQQQNKDFHKALACRAYIKHTPHYSTIAQTYATVLPNTDCIFLHADVCREELLIEIEAIY